MHTIPTETMAVRRGSDDDVERALIAEIEEMTIVSKLNWFPMRILWPIGLRNVFRLNRAMPMMQYESIKNLRVVRFDSTVGATANCHP